MARVKHRSSNIIRGVSMVGNTAGDERVYEYRVLWHQLGTWIFRMRMGAGTTARKRASKTRLCVSWVVAHVVFYCDDGSGGITIDGSLNCIA
jgi:hypothetical protein